MPPKTGRILSGIRLASPVFLGGVLFLRKKSFYIFLCPNQFLHLVPCLAVLRVNATSQLVPFQPEAVQGFSVFPFCLTSFLKNGYKKDRQLFADCDQSTVSFLIFSYCVLPFVDF